MLFGCGYKGDAPSFAIVVLRGVVIVALSFRKSLSKSKALVVLDTVVTLADLHYGQPPLLFGVEFGCIALAFDGWREPTVYLARVGAPIHFLASFVSLGEGIHVFSESILVYLIKRECKPCL